MDSEDFPEEVRAAARQYFEAREAAEHSKAAQAAANKVLKDAANGLVELMIQEGIERINYRPGQAVVRTRNLVVPKPPK